jgi:hypothetical protein
MTLLGWEVGENRQRQQQMQKRVLRFAQNDKSFWWGGESRQWQEQQQPQQQWQEQPQVLRLRFSRCYSGGGVVPLTMRTSAGKLMPSPVEYSLVDWNTWRMSSILFCGASVLVFSRSLSEISRRSSQ